MVDEIQIEIGVVSLSDERSILTEMGDDILSFGNSKAMAKQVKKESPLKREIEPIIVAWRASPRKL